MDKFAVIATGGKQYKVGEGTVLKVENLNAEPGDTFVFDQVLLVAHGEKVEVGTPNVAGAKVTGKVLRHARDRKKIIFKYSSKARFRKKKGHRQEFTEVKIEKV